MSSFESIQEDVAKRRKELFGDCALVEIIHLHDCLRGALKELQRDVAALSQSIQQDGIDNVADLERRVAGRFKVIWSVFRAHSAAEDEFIWPALRSKTGGRASSPHVDAVKTRTIPQEVEIHGDEGSVDQEQYEEDHADEERMFRRMDELLTKLHSGLHNGILAGSSTTNMVKDIDDLVLSLSKHLYAHLEKEETQCMPLVVKHLTKSEITDLVGQIMGKRSSDTIAQIMTMAVQNLNENDRNEMVKYMKQAMVGTFFEKWLAMSGWMRATPSAAAAATKPAPEEDGKVGAAKRPLKLDDQDDDIADKRFKVTTTGEATAQTVTCLGSGDIKTCATCKASGVCLAAGQRTGDVTSQTELEKLIRAIASNPELGPVEKQTTIQGLRDSVYKSNLRHQNSSAVANAPVASHFTPGESAT